MLRQAPYNYSVIHFPLLERSVFRVNAQACVPNTALPVEISNGPQATRPLQPFDRARASPGPPGRRDKICLAAHFSYTIYTRHFLSLDRSLGPQDAEARRF